jgi:hypothetical protein
VIIKVTSPEGSVTAINTALLPVYRIGVSAIQDDLAVALGYPGPSGLSNIKLMAVAFPSKAGMTDALKRIAGVSLSDDTGQRATEAIKAVVNLDVRSSEVESLQARVGVMLKQYRDFIRGGHGTVFEDWKVEISA